MKKTYTLIPYLLLTLIFASCKKASISLNPTGGPGPTISASPSSSSLSSSLQSYGRSVLNFIGSSSQLSNGKILFTYKNMVRLLDPLANNGAGSLTALAPLQQARTNHTSTSLSNGKVLLIGGQYHDNNLGWQYTDSVELYDPAANSGNGSSTFLTSLPASRHYHSAALLANGKVLILGGYENNSWSTNVYLYDPSGVGSFTTLNSTSTQLIFNSPLMVSGNKVYGISNGFGGGTVFSYDADAGGSEQITFYSVSTSMQAQGVLLANGKILIVGGADNSWNGKTNVFLYDQHDPNDPNDDTTVSLAPILYPRHSHQLKLLSNGKVLVVGGYSGNSSGDVLEVELYDPAANAGTGSSTALTSMSHKANGAFNIFSVSNGNVFITDNGGSNNRIMAYNPSGSGSNISSGPSLATATNYYASALVANGDVLIFGGSLPDTGDATNAVQVFKPASASSAISTRASLSTARRSQTATVLSSGKVLLAGGYNSVDGALDSVELYDPAANNGVGSTTTLAPLSSKRVSHTATLVANDKVIFIGGYDENWNALNTVEIYDPSANNGNGGTSILNDLTVQGTYDHQAVLWNNKIIVIGGWGNSTWKQVVSYDYTANSGAGQATVLADLITERAEFSATLLPNNKILIAGGYSDSAPLSSVELYDPAGNSGAGLTTALAPLSDMKSAIASTLLSDGKVLITGGYNDDQYFNEIEIYNPAGAGSSQVLSTKMKSEHSYHTATTLQDGRVFIFGGQEYYGTSEVFDIYTHYTPVAISVSGGVAPYTYDVTLGSGKVENGYFIPGGPGSAIITVTDADGNISVQAITTY